MFMLTGSGMIVSSLKTLKSGISDIGIYYYYVLISMEQGYPEPKRDTCENSSIIPC